VNDEWFAAWNIYAIVRVVVAHRAVGEAHHGPEKPVYAAAITSRTVVSDRTVAQRQAGLLADDDPAALSADRSTCQVLTHRAAVQVHEATKDGQPPLQVRSACQGAQTRTFPAILRRARKKANWLVDRVGLEPRPPRM
jgi:hypothetical protein